MTCISKEIGLAKYSLARMTILLIDDDPDDREIFCEAVKIIDPKIQCSVAPNPVEAFKILDDSTILPHYIFLDINMPVMDGRTCLEEIRKNVKWKDVGVIMYSTTQNKEEMMHFQKLGAKFLNKPASFEKLITALKEYLVNHNDH
jgi:DNA-binding response OmpR family regulator